MEKPVENWDMKDIQRKISLHNFMSIPFKIKWWLGFRPKQKYNRKTCICTGFAISCLFNGEHHYRVTQGAWPRDVKIVGVRFLWADRIEFTLESAEFKDQTPISVVMFDGTDNRWLQDLESFANSEPKE